MVDPFAFETCWPVSLGSQSEEIGEAHLVLAVHLEPVVVADGTGRRTLRELGLERGPEDLVDELAVRCEFAMLLHDGSARIARWHPACNLCLLVRSIARRVPEDEERLDAIRHQAVHDHALRIDVLARLDSRELLGGDCLEALLQVIEDLELEQLGIHCISLYIATLS